MITNPPAKKIIVRLIAPRKATKNDAKTIITLIPLQPSKTVITFLYPLEIAMFLESIDGVANTLGSNKERKKQPALRPLL